jgi:hypothetical protein
MSESSFIKGLSTKLLNNNLANKNKSVSNNSASSYKEKFEAGYSTQSRQIITYHFKKWNGEKGSTLENSRGHWVTEKSEEFNSLVADAGDGFDIPGFNFDDIPTEAVDAARDLRTMTVKMREALYKADTSLTSSELAELMANVEKGAMSRMRDDHTYDTNAHKYSRQDNIDLHEGAFLKANPDANLVIRQLQLQKKDVLLDSELKELKALDAQIKELRALRAAGAITDARVLLLMADTGTKRHSNMIAEIMYDNQLSRSRKIDIETKGNVNDGDIMTALERSGALDLLPEDTKNLLRMYVGYEKKAKGRFEGLIQERLSLDTTFSKELVSKNGEVVSVKMNEYYVRHADQIMQSTINKMSGLFGLRKMGFHSLDAFDEFMEQATKELANVSQRQRKTQQKALDQTSKYFKGQAQYDRSSILWKYVDIAKAMMAGTKLFWLPLSILNEAANIWITNGAGNFFSSFAQARKTYNHVINGTLRHDDSMLAAMSEHGSMTLDPLRNNIAISLEGLDTVGAKGVGLDGALEKTRRFTAAYAKVLTSINESFDVSLRLMNAQSTMLNILNSSKIDLNSQYFADHGFTADFKEKVLWLQDSKYVTKTKDGKIISVDYRGLVKLDSKFADDLMTSVNRLTDRTMQTPRFSDMPPWVNTALFAWTGQFKSFMIGSFGNQLAYHVRRPSKLAASLFAGQFAMSYMTYTARVHMMYYDDPEKIKEMLEPGKAARAAARMTGSGALLFTLLGHAIRVPTGVDVFNHGSITAANDKVSFLEATTIPRFTADLLKVVSLVPRVALGKSMEENDYSDLFKFVLPSGPAVRMAKEIGKNIDSEKRGTIIQESLKDYLE